MEQFLAEFQRTLTEAYTQLNKISEVDSAEAREAGKWSPREIVGHLIDSAANNHQRFIRAQFADDLSLPGYDGEEWVRVQQYQRVAWSQLLTLWHCYNQHLIQVVSCFPTDKLGNKLSIGGGEPVTIQFVIEDYLTHMQSHLKQILN